MERRQFLQSTGLGAAATMLGVAPLTAATTHLSFLKENVMSEQPRPTSRSRLKTPHSSSSTTNWA